MRRWAARSLTTGMPWAACSCLGACARCCCLPASPTHDTAALRGSEEVAASVPSAVTTEESGPAVAERNELARLLGAMNDLLLARDELVKELEGQVSHVRAANAAAAESAAAAGGCADAGARAGTRAVGRGEGADDERPGAQR